MAFQHIKNIRIAGMAACVPRQAEENSSLAIFREQSDYALFVNTTGVERRRVAPSDVCASDLCLAAAEELISKLGWVKEEVDCMIFASHSPDYPYPATSCMLQHRLGLSEECMCFDIALGCSGWIYGLSTLASIVSAGKFKKALLLAGDTPTRSKSPRDKSTYPLFGDAGSATAIEYLKGAEGIKSHLATGGANHRAIIIEDGGYRNPFSADSLIEKEYDAGVVRNRLQTHLDGMTVFSFGITKAPRSIRALIEKFTINVGQIDYLILHQANLLMNEKIRKKLGFAPEKTPSILKDFGNTSSSSIPLTIVASLANEINDESRSPIKIIACGFGVGLSWGSVMFAFDKSICCPLIEY